MGLSCVQVRRVVSEFLCATVVCIKRHGLVRCDGESLTSVISSQLVWELTNIKTTYVDLLCVGLVED